MWYIPDEEQTGTSAINQWICPLPGNSEQNAQDSADPETKGETNNKHVSADINIQNSQQQKLSVNKLRLDYDWYCEWLFYTALWRQCF